MEIWKDICGYEDQYKVSNQGRVKSVKFGKELMMKQKPNHFGYFTVGLRNGKYQKWFMVHRLVASAFIPNPDKLPIVNHKDENPRNNCVENLEWCTQEYNINYGTRNKKVSEKLSKPILCVETNKIFKSTKDAGIWLGISSAHSNICLTLKNKQKSAYGYHWKYVEKKKMDFSLF